MSAYMTKRTTLEIQKYAEQKNAKIVDLRSDTLTTPTESMKLAMSNAVVGDDVFGEDPTVNKLEKRAADLLGKEDAIFVPSGTMSNLIAIMNHCDVRGSEAYCGYKSHIFEHEQGGAAQIAGVTLCPLLNEEDGTFDLKHLESCIRKDTLHEPVSKLICLENTNNGRVIPIYWIEEVSAFAKKHNLKVHLDGARFWNAVIASDTSAKKLASYFDSVGFCLSKSLGAPVGSLLCGTKSFIQSARRIRKVLGGGMRQAGVIAAAGLVALDEIVPILKKDHQKAYILATKINQVGLKIGISVNMITLHTNIIYLNIPKNITTAKEFLERLENVDDEDEEEKRFIIRGLAISDYIVRFVFYHQITEEHLNGAILKIQAVINSYKQNVNN